MNKSLKSFLIDNGIIKNGWYVKEETKSLKSCKFIRNATSNCAGFYGTQPHSWYFIDLDNMQIVSKWERNTQFHWDIEYENDPRQSIYDDWENSIYSPGIDDWHSTITESGEDITEYYDITTSYNNKFFKQHKNTCLVMLDQDWDTDELRSEYEIEVKVIFNK